MITDNMKRLTTNPKLLDLMALAAKTKMTKAERDEQAISFVAGQTGIDKDRVREILG
jgi:hypothetical protein